MIKSIGRWLWRWWPTGLTLGVILWLTLAPSPVPETDIPLFPGADKIVHALMMAALTLVADFDLGRVEKRRLSGVKAKHVCVIALLTAIFAAIDEWLQGAMGLGRTADPMDLLADIAGILTATVTLLIIHSRQHKNGSNPRA